MTGDTSSAQTRSQVNITVAKDSMSASMILRAPGEEDTAMTAEDILEAIHEEGVVYGIDESAVRNAVEQKDYNRPVTIAEGVKPQKGKNSEFTYHFETQRDHRPKEDDDGTLDYKEIDFIQNTDAGTVLATKTPPTPGVPGKSVMGKELTAPNGRDLPFKHGENTEISEDGLELKASASGAIQFKYGSVSVLDTLTIRGDVDHTVGNINCKGSVIVNGDVKAGYTIKIDGDLEVAGNVQDAVIEVGGNIYIKGGFFGGGEGHMQAKGDITLKYGDGQTIVAGNDLMVGGELTNCRVTARNSVLVQARRGKIVGGVTRAGREIRSSILGSDAGGSTLLVAGFDVEVMRAYEQVLSEIKRLKGDEERVKTGLYSLYRLELDGKLSPEQSEALKKLKSFQEELPESLAVLEERKKELQVKMAEFRDARIVAEDTVYTGVRVQFGTMYREIVEAVQAVSFSCDGSSVVASEYKKSDE